MKQFLSKHLRKRLIVFICISIAVNAIRHAAVVFSSPKHKTASLSFDVEGGFTNQLLDLAYVTTLAISNKPCVLSLPELWSDGTQRNGVNRFVSSKLSFAEVFDIEVFGDFLSKNGVKLSNSNGKNTPRCSSVCTSDLSIADCEKLIRSLPSRTCIVHHVHIQAPFLHRIWSTSFLGSNQLLFDNTLRSLLPSPEIRLEVERIHTHFTENSLKPGMLFIHARIERDWHQHCLQWHPYRPNYMYNCYVGAEEIFSRISDLEIDDCDIHVTFDETQVPSHVKEHILLVAKSMKLNIVRPPPPRKHLQSREMRAAIEYFVALRADKFVRNSVSTLSALVMLQRQKLNHWSAQYNRGPIPLSKFIPGYRMPWVFTVRGPSTEYTNLMKLAVTSALTHTSMIPHAVIHPAERSFERVQWLKNMGVHIIEVDSGWDNSVSDILGRSSPSDRAASHLYADKQATLATYFRLGIGNISSLLKFEHILYTDTDVFFRKDVTLLAGGVELPDSVQMGFETLDMYPLNAGIFFASVPFLRETFGDLITSLLSSSSVNDVKYGPGDQGLLNKFYEKELRQNGPLLRHLNAKPYHSFSDETVILHLHGPKLSDYASFASSTTCRFGKMCAQAFNNGVCKYFEEIRQLSDRTGEEFLSEEEDNAIRRKCASLFGGLFTSW